jgi:hypothetical protein
MQYGQPTICSVTIDPFFYFALILNGFRVDFPATIVPSSGYFCYRFGSHGPVRAIGDQRLSTSQSWMLPYSLLKTGGNFVRRRHFAYVLRCDCDGE